MNPVKRLFLFIVCLISVLWSASIVPPSARAATMRPVLPQTLSCDCYSDITWAGDQKGIKITMETSNPGLAADNDMWRRLIWEEDSGQNNWIVAGVEKDAANMTDGRSVCGWEGPGLFFFYGYYANRTISKSRCDSVPTDEIDKYFNVQINYYTSGSIVWIVDNDHASACYGGCYLAGAPQTWHYEYLYEHDKNTWTGHNVRGVNWLYDSYMDTGGVWRYETNGGTPHITNPPQMYWHITPASGNNGGELWSCDYETGTTCTLGS